MRKITVFILLLLLTGCGSLTHNTELEKAIQSVVKDEQNSEIPIESLANFVWDQAFLFSPYTTQEGIEEQMGVDYKDPSKLDLRDDIYLLVFLNDDQVVQYVEINRQQSDFSIGDKAYLTPSNASIKIQRN